MTRAYKSNNSRAASAPFSSSRKGTPKVVPSPSPLPQPLNLPGRRVSSLMPPLTTPTVTTPLGPASPDDVIIDFGCNGNFLHTIGAFDNSPLISSSNTTIHLPDSSGVHINGSGLFCGEPALFVENFDKSLICSEFFTNNNCACLYINNRLFVFRLDKLIRKRFIDLIRDSINTHVCLNIQRTNGLYSTTAQHIRQVFSPTPQLSPPATVIPAPLSANISYFTTKLSNVEELVRFWHINLGHLPKDKLLTVVRNKLVDGLCDILTPDQISKHFPVNCPGCAHGSLSQKRHPKVASRTYVIGDTLSIDIFYAGGSQSTPVLTHSGEGYAVLCVDRGSGMSWVFLTKTIKHLLEFIQRMDRIYTLAGYNLKEVQIDAAFYTDDIRAYFQSRSPSPVKALVSAPHEHAQNGAAESLVKFFKNGIMKQLQTSQLGMP